MHPVFRVPLDADDKSLRILHRDGFDGSVFRNGFDLKLRRKPVDRLPVDGVHAHAVFLQDFREA